MLIEVPSLAWIQQSDMCTRYCLIGIPQLYDRSADMMMANCGEMQSAVAHVVLKYLLTCCRSRQAALNRSPQVRLQSHVKLCLAYSSGAKMKSDHDEECHSHYVNVRMCAATSVLGFI